MIYDYKSDIKNDVGKILQSLVERLDKNTLALIDEKTKNKFKTPLWLTRWVDAKHQMEH